MTALSRRFGLTLAALAMAAIPAAAQTTATVTGTLTDEAIGRIARSCRRLS